MRVRSNFRMSLIEGRLKGGAFSLVAVSMMACGSSSTSSTSTGSFPNFYTKAKAAVPSVTTSSTLGLREGDDETGSSLSSFKDPFQSYLTLPSTYSTSTTDFSTAFSVSQNFIGQVLNDAGISGPVKSM